MNADRMHHSDDARHREYPAAPLAADPVPGPWAAPDVLTVGALRQLLQDVPDDFLVMGATDDGAYVDVIDAWCDPAIEGPPAIAGLYLHLGS
ncbi:MAG TPA: hypothetical protein VE991_06470 [Acidimicrobiales bacterium]|nr:hypothetical protein [Acidimicrobiales bacterium]